MNEYSLAKVQFITNRFIHHRGQNGIAGSPPGIPPPFPSLPANNCGCCFNSNTCIEGFS